MQVMKFKTFKLFVVAVFKQFVKLFLGQSIIIDHRGHIPLCFPPSLCCLCYW